MTAFTVSPAHRAALKVLEELRRERPETAHLFEPNGYTGYSRVELDNLESRGGPSSVLNPLEAGRFASSRLSR